MTQEERLAYCKVCENRKLDSTQGFICSITNAPADFDGKCENFKKDETSHTPYISPGIQNIDQAQLEKINSYGNVLYAVLGGLVVALICAFLWAALSVITEYQVGLFAIFIGFIVGFSVRFFGAGTDIKFAIIGAIMAVLSISLGNIFTVIGTIANFQQISYFDVYSLLGLPGIFETMKEYVNPMDFLFYAIAAIEGYKFSTRPISQEMLEGDPVPPANQFRVYGILLGVALIGAFIFSIFNSKLEGNKQFLSEDGNVITDGNYVDGKEDGKWTYYYNNGNIQSTGNYKMGLETGQWTIFNEDGSLISKINYKQGMTHGLRTDYYEDGNLADSMLYHEGRMDGFYFDFYPNGNISSKGYYKRNNQDGKWEAFYEKGALASMDYYDNNVLVDTSRGWFENGKPSYEFVNIDGDLQLLNIWKESGDKLIADGHGYFIDYYENDQVSEEGMIKNGKRDGIWKVYFENGDLAYKYSYENGIEKLLEANSELGEVQINNGNGKLISYYEDMTVASITNYKDGLPHGKMETYYDNSEIMNTQNFENGKLNGKSKSFNADGTLLAEAYFDNDLKTGDWKWYYLNGNIESSVSYINDQKEGEQLFYSENGQITKKELYKNNELIQEQIINH